MPRDKFLIAPLKDSGLDTSLRPWLIPDEAFSQMNNAYVFRGRVRKRFGSQLTGSPANLFFESIYSRMSVNIGTTNGAGTAGPITVPGAIFKIGQQFALIDGSNNVQIFTVYQNGAMYFTPGGSAPAGTFNTGTGAVSFTTALPNATIYWYSAEPIMGIYQYESGPINNQPTIVFDTQFAYQFVGNTNWQKIATSPQWHNPTNSKNNYFWAWNLSQDVIPTPLLFISNFQTTNPNGPGHGVASDDPIYYYNGVAGTFTAFYAYFNPGQGTFTSTTGPFVETAKIIVFFKNSMLLLNTIENNGTLPYNMSTNTAFPQRCRYSAPPSVVCQNPPLAANSFYEAGTFDSTGPNYAAGGGLIDASTEEQIVSAEFIKDRLIVYFERSTWEIVYTGNSAQPFQWQKINTELGSESTFSTVPFDKQILDMSSTGVLACTGANVERIDHRIPDEVFEIQQSYNSINRVVGVRDYKYEMVYWTYPNNDATQNNASPNLGQFYFPNKVLVYNYRNNTWSINDDCITFFGYFEQQNALTWSFADIAWANANMPWFSSLVNSNPRKILAGNTEGFVFTIEPDLSYNAENLQITNFVITPPGVTATLTIINHGLYADTGNGLSDFISLDIWDPSITGITLPANQVIFKVIAVNDANTIVISTTNTSVFTGVYTGGGFGSRVSVIDIYTKQYNPYDKEDKNVAIQKIDFLVDSTAFGQITVDYFASSSNESTLQNATNNMLMGNSVLETSPYASVPQETTQTRLWHPIYLQLQGECIQLRLYLSDAQMTTLNIAESDFQMHAMLLYTQKTGEMR